MKGGTNFEYVVVVLNSTICMSRTILSKTQAYDVNTPSLAKKGIISAVLSGVNRLNQKNMENAGPVTNVPYTSAEFFDPTGE